MERDPSRPAPRRRRPMRGLYPAGDAKSIVYVLGSSRSGTSALRNAICMTRYNGYGEGHMQPLLSRIVSAVEGYGDPEANKTGNARDRLDAEALLRHLFAGYEAYLAEQQTSGYLLDKTPTSQIVAAVPMLNRYHSAPKFIFCARRHVDNISSKVRKFPNKPFANQCKTWAGCNRSWVELKDQLDGNYLDFDFHELTTAPETIARRIALYLDLSAAEEVAIAAYLTSARPQSDDPGRDLTGYLKFSELDWSAEDKETFLRICGPVGEAMGYGLEHYFLEEEQAAG